MSAAEGSPGRWEQAGPEKTVAGLLRDGFGGGSGFGIRGGGRRFGIRGGVQRESWWRR
jgi:hypothetical protein